MTSCEEICGGCSAIWTLACEGEVGRSTHRCASHASLRATANIKAHKRIERCAKARITAYLATGNPSRLLHVDFPRRYSLQSAQALAIDGVDRHSRELECRKPTRAVCEVVSSIWPNAWQHQESPCHRSTGDAGVASVHRGFLYGCR